MASIWVSPSAGDLLNNGQPWRHGEVVSVLLDVNINDLDSIELIGGQLPPGLFYNGGTRRVQGTILALPKDTPIYPTVFRVRLKSSNRFYDRSFRWIVDVSDEEQYWQFGQETKYLGTINRGSGVTIPLDLENPDSDHIMFKAVGFASGLAGSFEGLPIGLEIDDQARIVGAATITGNSPGEYYFRVYARDPDDLLRNPRGEGAPRTSEKIYRLTIGQEIVLDARLSDVVRWETPAGSLGSAYETYPSHFGVKAVPQYQVSQGNSSETQMIRYTLTTQSKPLPSGLLLDPLTGLITGRCPYVTVSKTFEFTVEARVVFQNNTTGEIRNSTIASERTFSVTIRSIFTQDAVTSLEINVPGPARQKIARWIWGNKAEAKDDWNADYLSYIGDGVTKRFQAPSRTPGKTNETITVLVDGVPTNNPWSIATESNRDYVEFSTGLLGTQTDLTPWTSEGDGNWIRENNNATVRQTINGNATVFYSDYTAFGKKLSGTIQVLSGAGDDDFIGFVVGFQPGGITGSTTNYLLIDWKKGPQDGALPGFAVSKVTRGLPSNAASWQHNPAAGVTELARGSTLGSVGWVEGRTYTFDIEYSETNLRILVDGIEQVNIYGIFPDGRFGFYNNSQGGVVYAGVASTYLAPPNGVEVKVVRYVNRSATEAPDKLTILGRDNLYRELDSYFGKKRQYRILLANGLNYVQDGTFMGKLKDYHHPTDLRIGKVASARARTPEGTHIYDIIYLGVIDPLEGAGGFNSSGQEEALSRYVQGQKQTAIPQWNLTKENSNYYPASIKNLRADLINKTGRLAGQTAYGISGREGLPLWMMSEQELGKPATTLGYVAAIELVYVKAGSGPAIVRALETAGFNEDMQGTTIRVDRYLLLSDGQVSTTFDGIDFGTNELTTFDGPDSLISPTTALTTFDTSLQSESKYYKFPPGDK